MAAPSMQTDALHPDLKDLSDQFMRLAEDARALAARLDDMRMNWTPDPRRWSIGQHLDHLNIVGRLYLPVLREAIRHGRARGLESAGPYRHGWLGGYFVRLAEPPPRRKFFAPPSMRPAARVVAAETLTGFLTLQDEVRACLREANGLDLGRVKVASPVTPLLRLSLGQAFRLVAAHERRHLWHSWQLRKLFEFPAPPADFE